MADESKAGSKKKRRFRFFGKRKNKIDGAVSTKEQSSGANKVKFSNATDEITDENSNHRPTQQESKSSSKSILHKNGNTPVNQRLQSSSMFRSWLCQTSFFKNMIESAFQTVDADGSGEVDEKELYSGLLLIHLKLGAYAGPAACKPLDREKCHAVFQKMDQDKSGSLDKEEFEAVMMVLFGNVMLRVAFQYACTLLIVPLIAKSFLDGVIWIIYAIYGFVSTLDEHSQLADVVEVSMEHIWKEAVTFWSSRMPLVFLSAGSTFSGWIDAIPESVWNTIPLTLISTLLSMMLIPWSLMKIDDFFQWLAEKKGQETRRT